MPVLTAIDILTVQRYIFSSKRLQDIISASWLVQWATDKDGALIENRERVIYAGGGNALLEFDSIADARLFAGEYTRRLLEKAPGLEVVLEHEEFPRGKLANAAQSILQKIAQAKLERTPSAEQLGLGVTARCAMTGHPANDLGPDGVPLSKMILALRDDEVQKSAKARWQRFLPQSAGGAIDFPLQIDHLGRSYGDTSLLGVVHLDGNGVGRKIKEWLQGCTENGIPDDEVKRQYKEFSKGLEDIVEKTFRALVMRVCGSIKEGEVSGRIPEMKFKLKSEGITTFLPLRPIIVAGDEMTFLCDGRIALDLATTALKIIERETLPHLGPLTASAGVALVRTHYPFQRAYEMAERLCAKAKAKRREMNDEGSWIDWHIGTARPGLSIDDLRRNAYRAKSAYRAEVYWVLTCRPYRLGSGKDDVESWQWLTEALLDSPSHGLRSGPWKNSKNKVKELMNIVRMGPDHAKKILQAWQIREPSLRLVEELGDNGFLHLDRTPLLDAVEIIDIHLPLQENTEEVIS